MKTIYKYSIVLLAALLCAPLTTLADEDTDPSVTKGNGVVLKKTVRNATDEENGEYILTLEAYATGTSATVITEETVTMPSDIVLLLDESGSMRANWFIQNKKGSAAIGELSADEVYIVNIDGKDYYMKGFYNNEEYQLTTTQVGGDYISQTQTGTTISYNNVGSNKYVQYTDGKYYLVSSEYTQSGNFGNTIYTYYLYITVDGAKKYLSDTNFSTDKPTEMPTYKGWNNQGSNTNIWTGEYITNNTLSYSSLGSNTNRYILYGGEYCQVSRGGGYNNRNLYITVNDQTRYLQNNDVLDAGASAPTGKNDNAVIWTGGYYIYESQPIGPSALTFYSVCPSSNTIPTATTEYNATPYDVTLNGTDYYVKYNDNYYKVEACYYNWSSSNTYYLTINIGGQKLYLNGTSFETAATGNSDRDANIWTGDIYMKSASGDMTFVYNETIPTSASDGTVCYTGSTAPAASDITVGTVYSTSTQFITREQIAKAAAKEFVQTVYANNPNVGEGNDRYHQVSVGWYSGATQNGWLYSDALTLLSSTGIVGSFQTAIDGVAPSGTGTKIDVAMQNAYTLLNTETVKNDGRNKIVVLFTDGEPGISSKTFDAPTARTAVEYANKIKDEFNNVVGDETYPAVVYSIGFLDKETSNSNNGTGAMATNDIRRFLHYVSSNYNIGTPKSTYNFNTNYDGAGGGDEAPHDYYIYSDGSNLSSIFQAVASQASSGTTSGGAGKKLTASTTTVLDIISQEFRLPPELIAEDGDVTVTDYIKVHTEHLNTSTSTADAYVWVRDATTDASPTIAFSKEDKTGNDIVRVNGFDFTQDDEYNDHHTAITSYGHWVGGRTIGSTTTYAGSKLVIEIPIIKADNYNGGFNTPTNTSSSALVYVNPETGKDETVLAFAIPDLDFPSLAVAKSGLEPGESAIFTVKQLTGWNADGTALVSVTDGISYTVIVTNDDTEITRNIVGVTDINGSPSKNVNGTVYYYEIIKDIPEGEYQVTETPWSWTYTTTIPQHTSYTTVGTNIIKQLVTKAQITTNHADGEGEFKAWGDGITKKIIIFEFNNSKKESNPAHGEDSKKNVFKGVGGSDGDVYDPID